MKNNLLGNLNFNKELLGKFLEGKLSHRDYNRYAPIFSFIRSIRKKALARSPKNRDYRWRGHRVITFLYPPLDSEMEKNYLMNFVLKKFKKNDLIFSCTVALTYECPSNCPHCYVTQYRKREAQYLNVKEYGYLFDQLKRMGIWHIDLTGGEPLQREDIFEIFNQIDGNYSTGILATNGLLLTKANVKKIKDSNIMVCKVSLGIIPKYGREYAAQKKIDLVLKGIRLLQKEKIFTFTQIYIERGIGKNKNHFEKMITACEKTSISLIHIISPMLIGNLRGRRDLLLSEEDKEYLKKVIRKTKNRISVFPDWEFFRGRHPGICAAVWGRTYTSAYGDVYPCNFLPEVSYGNVRRERFEIIHQRMRKQFKSPDRCPASNRRPYNYFEI